MEVCGSREAGEQSLPQYCIKQILIAYNRTLQELIAPSNLKVYSAEWKLIGSRLSLSSQIATASRIDVAILNNTRELNSASIAEKMSWVAFRETTRTEDIAYCLMGLSVNPR